jgi:hypothetical protein
MDTTLAVKAASDAKKFIWNAQRATKLAAIHHDAALQKVNVSSSRPCEN